MVDREAEDKVRKFLEQRLPKHVDLLQQMVSINSFTTNPQGVNTLGELTAAAFARLGFSAERIQAADFVYGQHLALTRRGWSKNHKPTPQITLISHLDTVYPSAEERDNDFYWRVCGDRIYGPGVYDIKGGTVMIFMVLAAIRRVFPDFYDSVNWLVLLNAAEEALVPDFGRLCLERMDPHNLASLVFEGGELNGNKPRKYRLVVARKGMARFHVAVEGKAAHAGTSHAQGANAILQMAEVIQRIAGFTDYQQAITFNVGTIAGGTVINRVPHQASAFVEMRAFSPTVFAAGAAKMAALNAFSSVHSANGGYPCQVRVNALGEWDPWDRNDKSSYLLDIYRQVGQELGLQIGPEERGGLSDGNWTWQRVPTVDGLGPDGGNAHCSERDLAQGKDQEFILPSSYVPKAALTVFAIRKLIDDYYSQVPGTSEVPGT